MKKLTALLLTGAMSLMLLTGCGNQQAPSDAEAETQENVTAEGEATEEVAQESAQETDAEEATTEETQEEMAESKDDQMQAPTASQVTVRIGGMSGPTSMGLVKLMDDAKSGKAGQEYEFAELATEASAFVAPLAKGELDIAAVPANLASVLYNNTEGKIQVLAINNLGVLNIVERGESIQSMADLAGKTIYATGQGATPEYNLRYLLSQNGLDADKDVTIQWCADTTELLSFVTENAGAVAMVPQPFATIALSKVEDLRLALDLNEEWKALDNGCQQVTGVIVARKDFIQEHPDQVAIFLSEYLVSMSFTANNVEEAAALIESFSIVPKAPIAQKALPGCHLQAILGQEMKTTLSGYLQILFDLNPQAVGGNLPADDFYYGA